MTASSISVVERTDGSCELFVTAFDRTVSVKLDVDEACELGRKLLDGGDPPADGVLP